MNFAPLPLSEFTLNTGVLVFLNGQFVPEERAVISVFDRGFLYGDGLFETIRVFNGKPFRWEQHLERLERGAAFLKINMPFSASALREYTNELIVKNKMPDALLRLTLSRGIGTRGYSPREAENPTVVMSLHTGPEADAPAPRWKLITSSSRALTNDPLSQFKTASKLPQIVARAEADTAGADEALVLNTDGFAVEGTSSNLFWIKNNIVCTPPLNAGILPGITRAVVLEICRSINLKAIESNICVEELKEVDGIFVSLTSRGVIEAASLDGKALKSSPFFAEIHQAYCNLLVSSQVEP